MEPYDSRMNPEAFGRANAGALGNVNRVYNMVYGWMTAALTISGLVAWVTMKVLSGMSGEALASILPLFYLCALVEIAMVWGLSASISRLSGMTAAVLFLVYSALNGVTLSLVFLVYTAASIQATFFITAGTFAAMALVGTVTHNSLSGVGRFCMMALFGIILALVVNLFLRSAQLDYFISIAGVLVFVGLTAWDAQKVRQVAEQSGSLAATEVNRLGILFALQLYLDFVNLFLYLLRFFGKRR